MIAPPLKIAMTAGVAALCCELVAGEFLLRPSSRRLCHRVSLICWVTTVVVGAFAILTTP